MIIVMLGGMIGPKDPAVAWMTEASPFGYPSLIMEGISMEPTAAVSAAAEPEMPANRAEVPISTRPMPPVKWPRKARAISISFSEMPPDSISSPESMKNGMAIKEKELTPENSFWATRVAGTVPLIRMAMIEPAPKEKAMGTPRNRKIRNRTKLKINIVYASSPCAAGTLSRSFLCSR